jgi:hypothetical protein
VVGCQPLYDPIVLLLQACDGALGLRLAFLEPMFVLRRDIGDIGMTGLEFFLQFGKRLRTLGKVLFQAGFFGIPCLGFASRLGRGLPYCHVVIPLCGFEIVLQLGDVPFTCSEQLFQPLEISLFGIGRRRRRRNQPGSTFLAETPSAGVLMLTLVTPDRRHVRWTKTRTAFTCRCELVRALLARQYDLLHRSEAQISLSGSDGFRSALLSEGATEL